jgi:GT2 family glycosyltransferase
MLDDDVELAEDSAERMLAAIEEGMDCVAADTFKNQNMSWKQKVVAFLSNFVYARKDDGWAFKQCRNGSFTFNGNPQKSLCLTETFAGPCWMVRKSVLTRVCLADELWLDEMGFAYGDDALESYKFYLNGYRSGVLYDSGVTNLDAKTSSGGYHRSDKKFYTRSFGMFTTWWRMIYSSRDKKWLSALLYSCKVLWQVLIHLLLGLKMMNVKVPYNYLKGQVDAWRYVHTETFKAIPSYVINK